MPDAQPKERPIIDYRFFKQLCELPFVDAIYLYGSRARGDHDEWSDVDLAIECPKATTGQWLDVLEIAENADILVDVQVTRMDEIKDEVFLDQVKTYQKVLYDSCG